MLSNDEIDAALDRVVKRLVKQNEFYNRLSVFTHMLSILLSAVIPILIDLAREHRELLLWVSIFSAIITLVQTFRSTFHLDEKIQKSATAVAQIKSEQLLFKTKTAPYDKSDDDNIHHLVTTLAKEVDEKFSATDGD